MSRPNDLHLKKLELCIEGIRELPHDAVKMLLTSVNNAMGTTMADAHDFEVWLHSLEGKDQPVIDMVASMLGIE